MRARPPNGIESAPEVSSVPHVANGGRHSNRQAVEPETVRHRAATILHEWRGLAEPESRFGRWHPEYT